MIALVAGIFAAAPFTVAAEDVPTYANGNCGDPNLTDVQWNLFKDGSMAFFGSGKIKDCQPAANGDPTAEWYVKDVFAGINSSKIAVERGITSIGNYAFYIPSLYGMFVQTYNVDLPASLTTIGNNVFENQNKLTKLAIPQNVTSIGSNAFKNTNIKDIDFYGNPDTLSWNLQAGEFKNQVTCHIRPEYSSIVDTLNGRYSGKKITFEANLDADQVHMDDGIQRNIKAYIGTEHSNIFCGAAPFVVVGTFSGKQKSVTHGNNGFVSAVRIKNNNGYDYYIHTNNYSRELKKATGFANLTEQLTSLGEAHPTLKLQISYEYIGTNTVKMIYHLTNTDKNNAISDVQLGGTGDIKIGADDEATINPILPENQSEISGVTSDNPNGNQIGFDMSSNKEYDLDASGHHHATLGFVAKNVDLGLSTTSPNATFFYGTTTNQVGTSATGVYTKLLIPRRIFEPNDGVSQFTGTYEGGTKRDSGISYYWDVGDIPAKTTMDYAVLFSVYGDDSTMEAETDASNFCNVYWKDYDGTDILVQKINKNDTPEYTGAPIVRPHDNQYDYAFSGWSNRETDSNGNYIYTAQYTAIPRKLFAGHSLTLSGDIGVNFFVDPPVVNVTYEDIQKGKNNGGHDFSVKFSWYDKKGEYKLRQGDLDYDNESGMFVARCNVAAAEMAYNIHAVAYVDGVAQTGEGQTDDYSVKEYGEKIISSPSGTYGAKHKDLVDLAKKMLDYGAKAQVLFDRTKNKNGTLIPFANENAGYTMQEHDIVIDKPSKRSDAILNTHGLKNVGTSLVFLSKSTLRLYYKVTDWEKFNELTNKADFIENGSYHYLEVTDIPAYELDQKKTFRVGDDEHYFSALEYAALMQTKTDPEKNLGTALYWYNQAAKEYFG